MNPGVLYGVGAFGAWGLAPVYWKLLKAVPSSTLLAHRIVWACVFYVAIVAYKRKHAELAPALAKPRTAAMIALAGTLIGLNWLVYIHLVNTDRVLEASLGYFLSPIVNVLLGYFVLRERLTPRQWLAVVFAFLGVSSLAALAGLAHFPWLGLFLPLSFAVYGLIKKQSRISVAVFSFLETVILLIPALVYLLYFDGERGGTGVNVGNLPLVAASGIVTGLPLLWFARSATRLPLSTVGILQYLSPTLQLLIGVLVYGEAFGSARAVGFALIWVGIALYLSDLRTRNRAPREAARRLEFP